MPRITAEQRERIKIAAAAALELRRRERARELDAKRNSNSLLPDWTSRFNRDSRYKIAFGGRGSGKSWAFARMLLLRAAREPTRVLCARELQISIKDSVHRLLADQVHELGLTDIFDVGQSYLRGKNGSEFIFKGLRHNAGEIKSMEGINVCWVEEAQAVSDSSWKLLIPTIRAPGSEIWISFNPDQETDPTYQRFVSNKPPRSIVTRVNYTENPWFPAELELERSHMERTDPDAYAHVWLGECRTYTHAQVLKGKWAVEPFEPQLNWDGPYYGADWGYAQDPTVLTRCWIKERMLFVEYEAYGIEVALDDTPELFDRVPGSRNAVIRADSARPETIRHLRDLGFDSLTAAKKWPGSVEDGVEFLRSFERIIIHPRCKHAADEARFWSFKVDRLTEDVLPVLKPGNDHVWDSVRYALSPIIRSRKTALMIPEDPMAKARAEVAEKFPGIEEKIMSKVNDLPAGSVCGRCVSFDNSRSHCREREFSVRPGDPGCDMFFKHDHESDEREAA